MGYYPGLGAGKLIEMSISKSSIEKLFLHVLKHLPVGLVPNNLKLGTKALSLGGRWQVLAYPQLLGAAKNKVGSLDNYKGLRDNQERGHD